MRDQVKTTLRRVSFKLRAASIPTACAADGVRDHPPATSRSTYLHKYCYYYGVWSPTDVGISRSIDNEHTLLWVQCLFSFSKAILVEVGLCFAIWSLKLIFGTGGVLAPKLEKTLTWKRGVEQLTLKV